MFLPFFASDQSFLDPQTTNDGKPYGPERYKQIVKECYLISKNCHTSYMDVLDMTPNERALLLQFMVQEFEKSEEQMNKVKQQSKQKNVRHT